MSEYNQRFDSFQQWVNKASSWLTRHPNYRPTSFQAVCFDAKGRHVRIGADFMRARDEGAFPVRWLWPDQIALLAIAHPELLANDNPTEEALPGSLGAPGG